MPDKSYKRAPQADFVLPFDLPDVGLRGRLVRLEATATQALGAHALPEGAARVTGEMLALAAILGTSLKLDGRLTIQSKSDGPLDLVTADYYGAAGSKPIGLRGYGQLDAERFAALDPNAGFDVLVGDGMLAITIEPRTGGQTYQGVVELNPSGVGASAEHYFTQSEQLPTVLKLAAGPLYLPGKKEPTWRAGGIMLQATPGEAGEGGDDWERLSSFLSTVEDIELLDTSLPAEQLLWRLFHEDETRVLPFQRTEFRCGCNTGRIATVLRAHSPKERLGLADPDGIIRARCEFCGKVHAVDPKTLDDADADGAVDGE